MNKNTFLKKMELVYNLFEGLESLLDGDGYNTLTHALSYDKEEGCFVHEGSGYTSGIMDNIHYIRILDEEELGWEWVYGAIRLIDYTCNIHCIMLNHEFTEEDYKWLDQYGKKHVSKSLVVKTNIEVTRNLNENDIVD